VDPQHWFSGKKAHQATVFLLFMRNLSQIFLALMWFKRKDPQNVMDAFLLINEKI
jgi:hypothetical protein